MGKAKLLHLEAETTDKGGVNLASSVPIAKQAKHSANEQRAYLVPLTSLRFFAAMLVVVHHWMRHWRSGIIPDASVPLTFPFVIVTKSVRDILWVGYQAVGFFFVLSGFVLAYAYIDSTGLMRSSRREFFIARFARIYPAYLTRLRLRPTRGTDDGRVGSHGEPLVAETKEVRYTDSI